jgi:hypothetical protein
MINIHSNVKNVRGPLFVNMEHDNTRVKHVAERVYVNTVESNKIVRTAEVCPYAPIISAEVDVYCVRVGAFVPIKK